jgi:3',5'-cyclic AMP phosphodiesterase CpdA
LPGEYALLLAAGDIADCRHVRPEDSGAESTARIIEAALRGHPEARVLSLGDNTYPVGLPAEFKNCFDPTWGRFKQRILPAAGNHEYYTAGAPGYYAYFGAQAGQRGKGYYATDLGSWRVIVLNSALRDAAFAEQLDWLKRELQDHRQPCTLAAFHHPAFTSGGHGNNAFMLPVWQTLYDQGVDVVLAGHDHHYERFAPMDRKGQPQAEGMTSFIVGTGGAQFSPLWWPLPATRARDNSVHGVLRLELHDGAYAWRFLPAQATVFADAGQGRCR